MKKRLISKSRNSKGRNMGSKMGGKMGSKMGSKMGGKKGFKGRRWSSVYNFIIVNIKSHNLLQNIKSQDLLESFITSNKWFLLR